MKHPDNYVFNGHAHFSIPLSSEVYIGRNFICNSGPLYAIDNASMSKIWVFDNAFLSIGDDSGISNTAIICSKEIVIGNNVNIGAGTLIIDTDFHSLNSEIRTNRKKDIISAKQGSVRIGDHVLIGARTIILKGVVIGNRSIVAAGSVVVKNIPERELWGGNPAQFIRKVI